MKLYYVYDALCGWCYGFSPVIQRFEQQYASELSFEVISGGMVIGDRVGPVAETADYIKTAYHQVEERTGVRFGKAFLEGVLEEGTAIFDSYPAALAMRAFKLSRPRQSIAFAGRIQRAIYHDGMLPRPLEGYAKLATEFGLDETHFLEHMNDATTDMAAQAEFELAQRLGITGFPTLLLEYGEDEKLGVLSRGYIPYDQLEKTYLRAKEVIGH